MSEQTWDNLGRNGWRRAPGGAQWHRYGESWAVAYPDQGLGLIVDRPRENQFGLYAEVTVEQLPQKGVEWALIDWTRLKLNDTDERNKFARALAKENGNELNGLKLDWVGMVKRACTLTGLESRKGEDIVDLAEVTVPAKRLYLVDRMLPLNETSLVYADGMGGKSLLALTLAVIAKLGLTLPGGLKGNQPTNVLYLDWETNQVNHARRLAALSRGLGLQAIPSIKYLRMSTPLVMSQARLLAEVDRLKVGLVIVDSAGFATHDDLNSAASATEMYNVLRSFGVTALVLHHVNKATAERTDGAGRPNGAAYWWNGARNAWEIRSHATDSDSVRLSLWHRKDNDGHPSSAPIGLEMRFAHDAIAFRPFEVAEDNELAQFGGARFLLRKALGSGLRTIQELNEETGVEIETIKTAFRRYEEFCCVEPGGRGRGNAARWGIRQASPEYGSENRSNMVQLNGSKGSPLTGERAPF